MGNKRNRKGSVTAERGKLKLRIYWQNPKEERDFNYRWSIATHKTDNPANREELEQRLEILSAKIEANAFYPCHEFPNTKISKFCHCPACAATVPLSEAHRAPHTLGELFKLYAPHEEARTQGKRVIEASTWTTKASGINMMGKPFTWTDQNKQTTYEFGPLTDYTIRELTPEAVKYWLECFQCRDVLAKADKPPASTKYMINLVSTIGQALTYGQFKRWWRNHPLLEYPGTLIETTKEERNRRHNKSLFKPFSLIQRDNILAWFESSWRNCSDTNYKGREKMRRFMLYHYMVIGFNQGMRSPSEMTALEWPLIDFHNRWTRVVQSREASGRIANQVIRPYTKTIYHREVPINAAALESYRALEQYRQAEDDAVFWNPRASNSNPLAIPNGWAPLTGEKRIRYEFEKCLEALKIVSPVHQGQYRMRHTFVTLMLDYTKFSDAKVAAMIGDNVDTMVRHYKGHCVNRWRDETDVLEMDAMNTVGKKKLRVVK